jgi:hypothetical protein
LYSGFFAMLSDDKCATLVSNVDLPCLPTRWDGATPKDTGGSSGQ